MNSTNYANQQVIDLALSLLENQVQESTVFQSSIQAKQYLRLAIGKERDECFCCLFLSSQHRLICFEKLFTGSISSTAVHPRIVVRRALELNAAAVILAHNHPSGNLEPSDSDKRITQKLTKVLDIVEVEVLDHLIVSAADTLSMAETKQLRLC